MSHRAVFVCCARARRRLTPPRKELYKRERTDTKEFGLMAIDSSPCQRKASSSWERTLPSQGGANRSSVHSGSIFLYCTIYILECYISHYPQAWCAYSQRSRTSQYSHVYLRERVCQWLRLWITNLVRLELITRLQENQLKHMHTRDYTDTERHA